MTEKPIINIYYLGVMKCEQTYYRDYDDDYLTPENPKYIYPFYKFNVDYEVEIKKGTKLFLYFCENTKTTYYVDLKGRIRMWEENALHTLLHDKYFNKNDKWLSNKYFKVVEDFVKEVLENE